MRSYLQSRRHLRPPHSRHRPLSRPQSWCRCAIRYRCRVRSEAASLASARRAACSLRLQATTNLMGRCNTQDGPAYNHLRYTQDSNLTNPKLNPNVIPNPLTLTVVLVGSLIHTNQTHHPRKSPLCFQKYIVISVCRLLTCIVLRIAKTDRSCRTVLCITGANLRN